MQAKPDSVLEGLDPPDAHYLIQEPHMRNFIDCMRTRKLPGAHTEIAHRAHTIVHCANICLRLGRPLRWDAVNERFFGDEEANRMIERALIAVLESEASVAAKQEACRRLWRMGTDASVDALTKMLGAGDLRLVEAACYAIGARPSAKADAALSAALDHEHANGRSAIENLIRDRTTSLQGVL